MARTATYGAVDTVLVDIDAKIPGYVDDDAGTVSFAEDDGSSYGVVGEIIRRALLTGGRVLAVRGEDVPGGGPVAAILRHPLRVPPDGAAACARRSTRVTRPAGS